MPEAIWGYTHSPAWALRNYPYILATSACLGLGTANAVRGRGVVVAAIAIAAVVGGAFAAEPVRQKDWANIVTCHVGHADAYTWSFENRVRCQG